MFKKNNITWSIVMLLLLPLIVSGCLSTHMENDKLSKPNNMNFIDEKKKIGIVSENKVYSHVNLNYIDRLAHVFDADENLFLGFISLDGKDSPEMYQNLYAISTKENWAYKINKAPGDYWIRNAKITEQYILWVETADGVDWNIFCMDRNTGEVTLVDTGLYNVSTGGDWPDISIENDFLCYNISKKGNKEMVSQLILFNLLTGQKTIIAEIEKENNFFGRPDIKDNRIVWHRGEWTQEMNTNTFLFDISTGITKTLPANANAIMPLLWDKYVYWIEYETGRAEYKYVVQFNINTGKMQRISKYDNPYIECWDLSIGKGKLTWRTNDVINPVIWDISNQTKTELDLLMQENIIFGDYLLLRNRALDGWGFYILHMDNIN